ncbi:CFI-box-CTERM domain-containing protein [Natronoglomus mannanivorans]|uniref:Uncharacterized protein n=1 Tax=Natronoglomus mannanivorans TaxID=2979990 RepID=A0AAP3E289_9EURY|nr:hypothetical protein [Halobacteria archaeon AArc-xg1-1]
MGLTRRAVIGLLSSVGIGGTAAADEGNDETFGYGMNAYGEGGFGGAQAECFIATAACGTKNHEAVVHLREFRDDVLLPRRSGRLFVRTYYTLSPPLAAAISRGKYRRAAVRHGFVRPLAAVTSKLTDGSKTEIRT